MTRENLAVLVTGCSSGIGNALVRELVRRGHRVVATARRVETLDDLRGERVMVERLDVTDVDSIRKAVAAAAAWSDGIDVVVNNAGYGLFGPAVELDLEDVRRQLETNVVGALAVTQAVVPQMVERNRGLIVNIGSVSGITATPFGGIYSASKAALHLLGDALRMEVAPFGIGVLTVQAGGVATQFPDTGATDLERYQEQGTLYAPVAKSIEQRARMSEAKAMPVEDFCRRLVTEMCRSNPRTMVRIGGGARLMPIFKWLPTRTLDRALSRRFGLDQLERG